VAEAFKARGLKMPVASLVTYAMDLRAKLAARTQFLTVVSKSVVYHGDDRLALKELAVDIPMRPWPHVILTLKDRTLSPVVGRFIDSAREVAKAMATNNRRRKI
jgi:hypothetical protein